MLPQGSFGDFGSWGNYGSWGSSSSSGTGSRPRQQQEEEFYGLVSVCSSRASACFDACWGGLVLAWPSRSTDLSTQTSTELAGQTLDLLGGLWCVLVKFNGLVSESRSGIQACFSTLEGRGGRGGCWMTTRLPRSWMVLVGLSHGTGCGSPRDTHALSLNLCYRVPHWCGHRLSTATGQPCRVVTTDGQVVDAAT